jgi:hypothetical protein
MQSRSELVLAAVLAVLKPLARMLLRHGVAYKAFSAAAKQVFLDAAIAELEAAGKKQTDSAISLLSGVHRKDVRAIVRLARSQLAAPGTPMNMASQVVGRWLSELEYLDEEGAPRALKRAGPAPAFDALVASISSDIRPRAVLDELVRLGMVEETAGEVHLLAHGFVPRQGFEEMTALLQDNLQDHAAAASLNLEGQNYLEQALFVDELTEESAQHLHVVSARAWRQALKTVMREARARFDQDQAHADPEKRNRRVRFGSYFYAADQKE